jgi:hypothetical protein
MENAFSIETCNIRTEAVYQNGLNLLRQGKINQNPYLEKGGLADPCLY